MNKLCANDTLTSNAEAYPFWQIRALQKKKKKKKQLYGPYWKKHAFTTAPKSPIKIPHVKITIYFIEPKGTTQQKKVSSYSAV